MFRSGLFRIAVVHIVRVFYPSKLGNRIKTQLLRMSGAQIGINCFIHQNVYISSPERLQIGDNCVLSRGVLLTATGGLTIGNDVLIGYDSKILTRNHVIPDRREDTVRWSGHADKPVVIEDDCWVAANVMILPGVTLSKGTVVAAGSVLTKDTEEYGVYAGIPAKKIKSR